MMMMMMAVARRDAGRVLVVLPTTLPTSLAALVSNMWHYAPPVPAPAAVARADLREARFWKRRWWCAWILPRAAAASVVQLEPLESA